MLERLHLSNFKKFNNLELQNLTRINLFVGDNNVGKTTILEAIFTFSCGTNFSPLLYVPFTHRLQGINLPSPMLLNPYRMAEYILYSFHVDNLEDIPKFNFNFQGRVKGIPKGEEREITEDVEINHQFYPSQIFSEFIPKRSQTWFDSPTLFNQFDIQDNSGNNRRLTIPSQYLGEWEITSSTDKGKKETFSISYPNSIPDSRLNAPLILTKFSNELSHRDESENRRIYAAVTRAGIINDFVNEINNSFGMQIEAIENIPYPDGSESSITLRLKGKNSHIPLYAFGEGLRRWYYLLGGMLIFQNSLHCIDEIDAGFHHQVQTSLAKQLFHYAEKYKNQLFMTTHNKEFLKTFLESVDDLGNNILEQNVRVITLRMIGESIKCRVLDGKEALQALNDRLEVRL